ncbi:hypothetical protein BOTBODRAFT_140732 [Botryobasidium botryosum FD-172 SS1]|uniref:Complex 1 LYR protein domain-containing protein n=1 Tax=Botryobasidium botryosum (strain FD-172 SS1) TaxID=930990 RepID=A0A067LWV6_BOTB1|nr:hypothetical protein BOTBODRAFT_140732 [Botryobasidium botryosum FD-172 SS1]
MSPASVRHSGLQRQVLALYRRTLRMVRTKPTAARPKFLLFARYHFRERGGAVSPRNITAVEYMVRQGMKQVEMFENPSIKDCSVTDDMRRWERVWRNASTSTGAS